MARQLDDGQQSMSSDPLNKNVQPDHDQSGYVLEEFGSLELGYYPSKVNVFQAANAITYITMVQRSQLIIFMVESEFKQNKPSSKIDFSGTS